VAERNKTRQDEILELAARQRREKQVVDVEPEKTLLVIFGFDGVDSYYGLPAEAVESIVAIERITYVPGTPPWILGVVNVRGEIESVLDLRAVLGQGTSKSAGQRGHLLIAHDGLLRSGLLVDRMIDIADIPVSEIQAPAMSREGSKRVYVVGEAEYRERALVILGLAEVFRRALDEGNI
jgi:purine-binding chemotaxis protein CheW